MNKLKKNLTKNVTVTNKLGLHARPAAKLAELAAKAKSSVWMIKNGDQVDASSIIDILSLSCFNGSEVTLQVEDPVDIEILNKMVALFKKNFKE
ncbi:MAG: HPr family phosphocarrier protein [Dissulfuribacterales bacterium]